MNRLTAFCLLFISAFFLAAQDQIILKDRLVTINCKGISFIGSGITVDDAKMFAVNDAKRNALEQVGTYLESSMEMKDYMITKDEIQTYTAGILKAEVLASENKVVEGTFAIEVLIKAEIDTEYLKNRLTNIQNDAPLKKMLEEQKRLNDKLTKEINELKEQKTGYIEKSKDIAKSLAAADWFDIGFKAQESGNYQEALKNYGKALELDPKNSLIYNNRGLIYYFMKDFPKAESNFDKAIELNPKLYMAFNNKAIIYYERRLYEQAIRYFDMVIMLDPAVEQPYYNRAFAYYKLGKTEPCLSDLRTYLKMAGNKHGDEQRIINFIKDNEKQPEKTPEPVPEPEMMTVPDLYNTTPETAKKLIKDSGLELGIIKSVTDEDKGFDRVIGQSLKKGLKVKKGAVIDITVNEEAADGW